MAKTVFLSDEQAEFLITVMNWWKDSGVNYWSAQMAKDLLEKFELTNA